MRRSVFVLVLFFFVTGLFFTACRKTPLERGMEALVEACSSTRLVEPRLSGGFHAARYLPALPSESPAPSSQLDSALLKQANDGLAEAANSAPPSRAAFLRGRYLLATGKLQEALEPLRKAAQDLKDDSEAQNDYGAVQYQTGHYEDALDQFLRALNLRPNMPEALTNTGLCYQKLLLIDEAQGFFQRALQHEQDSTWGREIQDRLKQLSAASPPMKKFKDRGERIEQAIFDIEQAAANNDETAEKTILERNYLDYWEALPITLPTQYLQAKKSGNEMETERAMKRLRLLGSIFEKFLCDSMGTNTAAYLEALPDDRLETQLSLYSDEAAIYPHPETRPLEKATQLEALADRCNSSGNQYLRCVAQLRAIYCYYYAQRSSDAIRLEDFLLSDPASRNWNDLRRNVLLQNGIYYYGLGRFSAALRFIDAASSLCTRYSIPDPKTLQYTGTTLEGLGDLHGALDNLRQSSILYLRQGATENLAYNYLTIADIYRLQGRNQLALLFGQKALRTAQELDPQSASSWIAQAASFNAERQAALDDIAAASKSLDTAFAAAKTATAEPIHTRTLLLIRAGDVALKQGHTPEALKDYQDARSLAEGPQGSIALALKALRRLARADSLTGNLEGALNSLDQALQLIERTRGAIIDPSQKTDYLDATHGVYEDLISLQAEPLNNPEQAFAVAEQSRGRTLLDQITAPEDSKAMKPSSNAGLSYPVGTARPIDLTTIESSIPSDLVVLEYAVTDEATYIFVVKHAELRMVKFPIKTVDLNALVSHYVELLKDPNTSSAWMSPARGLYDALIAPVQSLIPADSTICIAPDRMLDVMSFAALLGPDGRSLLAAHPLTYAPSASILKLCLDESRRYQAAPPKSVVAIGNPAFDRTRFPTLRDLPSADEEAADVASCYDEKHILIDRDATEYQLRNLIPDADVLHVASHCLVDDTSPWRAELVLAKPSSGPASSENDGVLQLNEISGLNLHHTQLVVLSSCQSAIGQYYRGEGLVSLVRPFIAAKVPMVVASLWKVDSEPTADLFVKFHTLHTKRHEPSAVALRNAQLQLSQDSRYSHPYFWAPFIAVGD